MSWGLALLTIAVASSVLAVVLPWLRRDEWPADAWERKAGFVLLIGDAFYHWWAFAHAGSDVRDPTWLATLSVLMVGGWTLAAFLVVRGYELPPLVRWPLAGALGVLEPALLVASFVGVHGPVPLY